MSLSQFIYRSSWLLVWPSSALALCWVASFVGAAGNPALLILKRRGFIYNPDLQIMWLWLLARPHQSKFFQSSSSMKSWTVMYWTIHQWPAALRHLMTTRAVFRRSQQVWKALRSLDSPYAAWAPPLSRVLPLNRSSMAEPPSRVSLNLAWCLKHAVLWIVAQRWLETASWQLLTLSKRHPASRGSSLHLNTAPAWAPGAAPSQTSSLLQFSSPCCSVQQMAPSPSQSSVCSGAPGGSVVLWCVPACHRCALLPCRQCRHAETAWA